jgi:hypothetical protein
MAPESTGMRTNNLSGHKRRAERRADPSAICEPIVWKSKGALTIPYKESFTFVVVVVVVVDVVVVVIVVVIRTIERDAKPDM